MKIIRRSVIIFLLLFVIFAVALVFSYPFLAINKPINSNNLVVEGWLTGHELETILFESQKYGLQKVIVAGKYYPSLLNNSLTLKYFKKEQFVKWNKPGVLLLTNSSLMIDLSKLLNLSTDSIYSISVKASDTQRNNVFAHFNLVLNGKLVGDTFVNDSVQEYLFEVNDGNIENSFLAINFDNDCHTKNERRNLYIESIEINNKLYPIDKSIAFITRDKNFLTTGFNSEAEGAKQYILALGIAPQIIEIVEFEQAENNQTMVAAIQVKDRLKSRSIKNLNVSSSGLHGRRTYMTYQKILGDDISVGIINAELELFNRSNWYSSTRGIMVMIDEFFSYIFAWVYLALNY